ncbi:TetR/AcrR family transcriptional regulator C-terminal domain-containing protein [Terracidiphilus gabretensis]|jgi:TetR/AcrR family transcriptional regulator, tetracycline repressor protein|uniref:TetR/AcrR family transcriptional regulator C-terminal domain-containing protein n=1 Tax=Terracidiphilus gabretensis TaxID=1577687 RepID=UPI00071B982C|nr:TetR/AcrR family transcriptional regulator C-terminal domain-containing protein [Terracidiphilus gabretensis]
MPLDRQLILHHAFGVLNEGGLEGLTLRKLAARLEVQAPAIYWHFKSKQDLLDEMGTQVLLKAIEDEPKWRELETWQELAFVYCTSLRRTFLRHRDGAKMASGTYLTDTKMYEAMEMSLQRFTSAGFSLRQAVVALTTLYSYTVGFVIEEQATQIAPGMPNEQYALNARDQRVNKDLYPLAAAAGAEMFTNHDSRFEEGVRLIVAGIASALSLASKAD